MAALQKDGMQGRNVTETDENFRMGSNQIVVEERQNPRCSVAAAKADNSLHLIIGKSSVDVGRPQFVTAGQIAVMSRYGFPYGYLIAKLF